MPRCATRRRGLLCLRTTACCFTAGGRRTQMASVRWRSAVESTTGTRRCPSSCHSEDLVGRAAFLDPEESVEKTGNQDHRANQVEITCKHDQLKITISLLFGPSGVFWRVTSFIIIFSNSSVFCFRYFFSDSVLQTKLAAVILQIFHITSCHNSRTETSRLM